MCKRRKASISIKKCSMLQVTSLRSTHRFWTLQETNIYARPNIKEIVSLYEIVDCNLTLNKCSLISPSRSQPAQLQDKGSRQHTNHRNAFQSTSTFQWEITFFSFATCLCSWYFQRKSKRLLQQIASIFSGWIHNVCMRQSTLCRGNIIQNTEDSKTNWPVSKIQNNKNSVKILVQRNKLSSAVMWHTVD